MRNWVIAAVVGLTVAGCGTMKQEDVISYGATLLLAQNTPLPSPTTPITFQDNDNFDLTLHSTLMSRSDVKVSFPNTSGSLPARVDLWVQAARRQGGALLTCDINTAPGLGGGAAGVLISIVSDLLWQAVQNWALYRPARGFSVIQEFDSRTTAFSGVRFVKNDQLEAARSVGYRRCT